MTIEVLHVDDDMSQVVSHHQLSMSCGWQLMFHRGRVARGPRGAALLYGSAVHEGIEAGAGTGDVQLAIDTGLLAFHRGLDEAEAGPGLRWMDPPRMRKDGQPYKGDEGKVPTREVAEAGIRLQVGAWMKRYGHLEVVREELEREVRLDVGNGWELICRLDMPTAEGGLLDVKTAKAPWDEHLLTWKRLQAQLYMPAYHAAYGEPPAYFAFHVLPRGTDQVQVVEVEYDPAQLRIVYDHLIPGLVRQIEARAYLPNTAGWWHGPDYCDFWQACPLGGGGVEGDPL